MLHQRIRERSGHGRETRGRSAEALHRLACCPVPAARQSARILPFQQFDAPPQPVRQTRAFSVPLARPGSELLIREIDRLRAAVGLTRRERPFHVDAWVVLPDVIHCVWTLEGEDLDFSARWSAIRWRFSRGLSGVSPIWSKDIEARPITGMMGYADAVRACWFAPVSRGLVADPKDWPYSSLMRESGHDPREL